MPATRSNANATPDDALPQLQGGIAEVVAQLQQHASQGWGEGALPRLAEQVGQLHRLAGGISRQAASAVAQLHRPLLAWEQSRRQPDAGTTSALAAAAQHLAESLDAAARQATPAPAAGGAGAAAAAASRAAAPTPTEPVAAPPQVLPLGEGEPPYRVLVVEDDRDQALFAEGILQASGIETEIVADPHKVLEAMVRMRPDLVLMDLHMPGLSGTELTAAIRREEAFLHTPIVFLTGDTEPDRQFEVLEHGADDFLLKPIRPRHLIAAVHSRVARARALGRHRQGDATRNPATGLEARPHLLQRLGASLATREGAVHFVEIEGIASLRDRYGYGALERLMTEAGRVVAQLAEGQHATRLNDNAFLVHAPSTTATGLEAQAKAWRDGIGRHAFSIDGHPLRLRATVGSVALAHGFNDAASVLEAAEAAARQARVLPLGVAAWTPPAPVTGQDMADLLRDALADARFELIYQPIVAVAGGDQAQYQTLLRMRDAEGVLRSAAEIVPVAESSGLIHDVDRWALERALDVLQQRQAQQRPMRLFVPQSPLTLARESYAGWLAQAIAVRALEGQALVIDVRLADALIHSLTLRQFCEALAPAGVQFCLSQYEHSADADALVGRLPLAYLRLSARYAGAQDGAAVRDEMRVAIDRAHQQGLQVIGHRIEDPQAAAALWMGGIDFIQGNLVQQAASELDFDFQHAVL